MSNYWRRPDRPLAIAHRGHSIAFPDNTLAAYRAAIELGAEMIEADVNMTRDGQLVMIHDTTLGQTTNGHGRVRDATMAELESLDAGGWFDPTFKGLSIPSTEETLELIREAGILVCFEVKADGPVEMSDTARALVTLLSERDALGFALMSGYDHEALALATSLAPELVLAPERLPDDVPPDPENAAGQALALRSPIIQVHHRYLTRELVDTLHSNDIALWSWPTTEEDALVSSIEIGADAVMGDDIRLMIQVLDRLRPRPRSSGTSDPTTGHI